MRYNQSLERQMLDYFSGTDIAAFPTFCAFAESIGVTTEELTEWKSHPSFAAAWRECEERQRARLISGALTRRYDGSFAKFLLQEMLPEREADEHPFSVTVEVVD